MAESDVRIRAVVAVSEDVGGRAGDRHVFGTARAFGCLEAPVRLDGFDVYFPEAAPLEAGDVALSMALRVLEDVPSARVVAHVSGPRAVASDPSLREALTVAPEGLVLVTDRAAPQLGYDRRRSLGAYRNSRLGATVFLTPDPREDHLDDVDLVRSASWLPLGRYIIQSAEAFDVPAAWLEGGLLAPERIRGPNARDVVELASAAGLHLVHGPAWIGKSHVARALETTFRESSRSNFVAYSRLGGDRGVQPTTPRWWTEWQRTTEPALLLLDGADEAHWASLSLSEVLEPYRELDDDARARLSLTVFQRDDASLAATTAPGAPLADARKYRLLPIDERAAALALDADGSLPRGREALERACARLARVGAVELASVVPALRAAARLEDDAPLERIWGEILEGLFRRPSGEEHPQRLRDLAARLAATMLLSGTEEIGRPGQPGMTQLEWTRVFDERSLSASLELERAPVLFMTPTGLRFRERHTEELLASWELASIDEAALRLLVVEPAGRMRDGVEGLLRGIADIRPERKPAIERWRATRVPPLDPRRAEEVVRALSEVVVESVLFLEHGRELARLGEAETYALGRLENANERAPVRYLILELAWANGWKSALAPAIRIALSPGNPSLKQLATALVCERGSPEDVDRLRGLLDDRTEEGAPARAHVLGALLGREPLEWILDRAPVPEQGLYDARTRLLDRIAQRMTAAEARLVVERASASLENASIERRILRALEVPAVDALFADWDATNPRDADLVGAVVPQLGSRGMTQAIRRLDERLSGDPAARRALYERLLRSPELWRVGHHVVWDEDAAFLLELAKRTAGPPRPLLEDVHAVSRFATSEEIRAEARRWLEDEHAGFTDAEDARVAEIVLDREKAEEWAKRRRAEDEARRRDARTLSSLLSEVLDEPLEPRRQLEWLSALAFGRGVHRLEGVDGEFDALPTDLRRRVIERLRELLQVVDPTPTPRGTSFGSALKQEADAFIACVLWRERPWLDAALIRAFLPAALFCISDDRTEVVRECFEADREATLDAVASELERDALRGAISGDGERVSYASVARVLPPDMFAERRLREKIVALTSSHEILPEMRADLLRILASRTRPWPMPSRETRQLARALADSPERLVRLAAIDVLLRIDRAEGLRRAVERVKTVDDAAIALAGLDRYGLAPGYALEEWHDEQLLELASVLCTLELDWTGSGRGGGYVGPVERLYDAREDLLAHLATREGVDVERIVELVPETHRPERRRIVASVRSRGRVAGILRALAPAPSTVPPEQVLRALDRSPVLELRSASDVFEAIPMLLSSTDHDRYKDLVAQIPGDAKEDVDERKMRHERALQSYVELRLDLELRRLTGGHACIYREPELKHGDRPDYVTAVLDSSDPGRAQVPIEVKWAHNPDCVSSLKTQLGSRYLVDQRLQYGVYVVGFGPVSDEEVDACMDRLDAARAAFQAENDWVRIAIVPLRFGSRVDREVRRRGAKPKKTRK